MENIKQQTEKLLNFPTDAVDKKPPQNTYMKCAWKANLNAGGIGTRHILLRWLFWLWRKVSPAVSYCHYWMLVQNNYLLAKNDRTLTLQTYWIHTTCLRAMSGVIQFCLRRTIYYERWVKEASSLIAHQNHYHSIEGPRAASGQTRQHWSRLPRDQTQFALWAAAQLWAISRGWGRQPCAPAFAAWARCC